jgi:hypothetical protein
MAAIAVPPSLVGTSPQSTVDYGTDFSCTSDLDPGMVLVSGRLCLVQAIYRRLITPRGMLIDDPNYGTDIGAWLNDSLMPGDVARKASQLAAEVLKDERVVACATTGVYSAEVLTFTSQVTDGAGPFTMVLIVSDPGLVTLVQAATVITQAS